MDNIESRIIAFLNGELADIEVRELMKWVEASQDNAREFARISLMHGQLRGLLSGERQARNFSEIETQPAMDHVVPSKQVEPVNVPVGRWRSKVTTALVTMAAAILVAVGIYVAQPTNDVSPIAEAPSFALVEQVTDVVWTTETLAEADRVGTRTLEFDEGIVRLLFDSGVDVTLEGPAKFELLSDFETRLHSGVLVANVPPGAEGFTVDTPSAKVIDLGTSFGINVGEEGSGVSVFDGEVEVISGESDSPRKVVEGESVRLGQNGNVETAEFNVRRFERLWPAASGVAGTGGMCRLIPPWSRRFRMVRSDEDIFVLPEGHSITLAEPLTVNIAEPGEYNDREQLSECELEAGDRVRSYLIHYWPTEGADQQDADQQGSEGITGSITFSRPVVGLIVLQDQLVESASLVRHRAGVSNPRRQLEFKGQGRDKVSLSQDRRTVSVELSARGRTADLVRVIVEGDHPHEADRKKRRRRKRDKNNLDQL